MSQTALAECACTRLVVVELVRTMDGEEGRWQPCRCGSVVPPRFLTPEEAAAMWGDDTPGGNQS